MKLSIPSHSFRLILPTHLPGPALTRPWDTAPPTLIQATAVSHLSPGRCSRWASWLPPASLTHCPLGNSHMLIHMSHCGTPLLKACPSHCTQSKSSSPYDVIRGSILSGPLCLTHSSVHTSTSHMYCCPKIFLSAWPALPLNICRNGSSFQDCPAFECSVRPALTS